MMQSIHAEWFQCLGVAAGGLVIAGEAVHACTHQVGTNGDSRRRGENGSEPDLAAKPDEPGGVGAEAVDADFVVGIDGELLLDVHTAADGECEVLAQIEARADAHGDLAIADDALAQEALVAEAVLA